jgi:hypothetical protein
MQVALAVLPSDVTNGLDIESMMIGLASAFAACAAPDGSARPVLVELGVETFIDRQRTDRCLSTLGKLDPKLRQRIIVILSQLPAVSGAAVRMTPCNGCVPCVAAWDSRSTTWPCRWSTLCSVGRRS